jgi:hypothetical protein
VREIQGHLRELYGIDVSPDLVSAVTDAVLDEVATWQNRPLEATYPLVFFDALRLPRSRRRFVGLGTTRRLPPPASWLRRPWGSGSPGPSAA